MEDEWLPDPNMKPFSLIREVSPEEEAQKDTFVDIVVYNHWKKAERRLYQKLKAERIARQLKEQSLKTVDDITSALNSLNIFKSSEECQDPLIDDLITKVEAMKVDIIKKPTKS